MTRKATRRRRTIPEANPMLLVMKRVSVLSAEDVATQDRLVRAALDEFRRGVDCENNWCCLVDATNMAKTFSGMGIGGGAEPVKMIEGALQALADVHARSRERGTWTLYAPELAALDDLVWLYCAIQCPACTYGEFHQALHDTNRRINQTRAGNGRPGSVVVVGSITGQPFKPVAA